MSPDTYQLPALDAPPDPAGGWIHLCRDDATYFLCGAPIGQRLTGHLTRDEIEQSPCPVCRARARAGW